MPASTCMWRTAERYTLMVLYDTCSVAKWVMKRESVASEAGSVFALMT